jgi:trk system potassium uptake protein TrkA
MYILVVGGGKVGYYLTKILLSEGHEVLVLEKDAKRVERIVEEMGSVCLHGDGCEASTLAEAGAERADILIAVTDEDEDNLVACQVARHKFNVPRTIARINNPRNESLFKKLGIDVTVSATNLILEYISEQLPTHPLTRLLCLNDGQLEIVEIKIPPTSSAIGKRLSELPLPPGTLLSLIIRRGQPPQLPDADTLVEAEDRMIGVVKPELEEALLHALGNIPSGEIER